MKKLLVFVIFIILAAAVISGAEEGKKILNIQKAYVFLQESLLISDTDLNCSYFIKDSVPQDIRVVGKHVLSHERQEFTDYDELVINKGSKAGLKEGDMLMILSEGQVIRHPGNHDRLGRYFLKKSLAQITCIYDDKAVIQLQKGCNPINIGDFGILYKPEATVFEKKIDYKYCRIPANAIHGTVVFCDLAMGTAGEIAGESQYVTVDLGEGVVGKGANLLIYRVLASDLPPLIIGLGIVIHSENTNSTVKILDSSSDIRVGDRMLVLPEGLKTVPGSAGEREDLPVVEGAQPEGAEPGQAEEMTGAGAADLKVDVLFDFDKSNIKAEFKPTLDKLGQFLLDQPDTYAVLSGFCDSIGTESYNIKLSQRRAESVRNYLSKRFKVDKDRLLPYWYGYANPVASNETPEGRAQNRRVTIAIRSGK